jgi:hypothetical protein
MVEVLYAQHVIHKIKPIIRSIYLLKIIEH